MADGDALGLLAGAGEETSVPERLGPGGILLNVVVGILGQPHHRQVTKFV